MGTTVRHSTQEKITSRLSHHQNTHFQGQPPYYNIQNRTKNMDSVLSPHRAGQLPTPQTVHLHP